MDVPRNYILGISAFFHDSAGCLLSDGQFVAAAPEERFSRRKHDATFPFKAVNFCLKEAGITPDRSKADVFYPSPFGDGAFLTIDGVGIRDTTSSGYAQAKRIHLLKTLAFPHSLGLLYSAFIQYAGFKSIRANKNS